MRLPIAPSLALFILSLSGPARADDTPIIMTYELRKQSQDARLIARNPKAFWIHQILARIEDKVPALSKPPKLPVTVSVSFVVGRDGRLTSKTISTSSGNAEADRTAMAMLERAQPFQPMPDAMSDTEMVFTLPVSFR